MRADVGVEEPGEGARQNIREAIALYVKPPPNDVEHDETREVVELSV